MGFLFIQMIVSLAVQSFLVLWTSTCQLFALIIKQMKSQSESLSCRVQNFFILFFNQIQDFVFHTVLIVV